MQQNAVLPEHPWDRQPGEPQRWFARFTSYRHLGPGRRISQAYARERPDLAAARPEAPPEWYRRARQWQWRERAAAWDEACWREEMAAVAARRRALLDALLTELEARRQELASEPLTWRSYLEALRTVCAELRLEYGQPTHHLHHTISIRQIVERIAAAEGVDADELERRTRQTLSELGLTTAPG